MKASVIAIVYLVFAGVVAAAQTAPAVKVDPSLRNFALGSIPGTVSVVVLMELQKPNVVPRKFDSVNVKKYLQGQSQQSVRDLSAYFKTKGLTGADIKVRGLFWINNSFQATVTVKGLQALTAAPHVKKIYANARTVSDIPRNLRLVNRFDSRFSEEASYAFKDLQLDKLIAEMPTVTGKGVLVGHIDTGVDGAHSALKDKIALFYDVQAKKSVPAIDSQRHGTHTAGTVLGGDRKDNMIGVAPEAKLISVGPGLDYDNMLLSMQLMLDPDGNPETKDGPKFVTNSWNCNGAPDVELFYTAIGAWDAGGVLPVFSAGNSGPEAATITRPHEHPSTLAVGATQEDGKVTDFSSRGPGKFRGVDTQKPDLTAPGNNITSSLPGGGYGQMSGTSMATPHVAGLVALMVQVNPSLNPVQLKEILIRTARSVDASGNTIQGKVWNANYGFGKADALAAVLAAKNFKSPDQNGGALSQPWLPGFERGSDVKVNPAAGSAVTEDISSALGFVSYAFDFQPKQPSLGVGESMMDSLVMPAAYEGDSWLTAQDLWGNRAE